MKVLGERGWALRVLSKHRTLGKGASTVDIGCPGFATPSSSCYPAWRLPLERGMVSLPRVALSAKGTAGRSACRMRREAKMG